VSDLQQRSLTFSVRARLRSFGYALSGLGFLVRTQQNAWIHALATTGAVTAALVLKISGADWRWVITAIFLVWMAEALNTAIECICDLVSPSYNLFVKRAKDLGAAAVLISAFGAAVIGALTFWPYLQSHPHG
jgi:diacylglycerol kinase (ATP)